MKRTASLFFPVLAMLLGGCSSIRPDRGDARFEAVQYGAPGWLNQTLIGKDYFLTLPSVPVGASGTYEFTIDDAPGMGMGLELELSVQDRSRWTFRRDGGLPDGLRELEGSGTQVQVQVMDSGGRVVLDCSGPLHGTLVTPTDTAKSNGWNHRGGWLDAVAEKPLVFYSLGESWIQFRSQETYRVEICVTAPRPLSEDLRLTSRFHRGNNKG